MKIGRFIVGASYAAALLLVLWYDEDDDMSRVVGSGRGGPGRCCSGGRGGEETAGEAAVAAASTPVVDLASAPSSCGTTAAVVAMESTVSLLGVVTLLLGFSVWKIERNALCDSQTCQITFVPFSSVLRAMVPSFALLGIDCNTTRLLTTGPTSKLRTEEVQL